MRIAMQIEKIPKIAKGCAHDFFLILIRTGMKRIKYLFSNKCER